MSERERERGSLDQRGDAPSTIDFAAVVNPRRNWLESRLRARYFVATRMFLPGRFYRRSRHHEGKFLRCYLSPGVSRRCRGAPEVLRRFIPRKLGDITRDGTFSILSGRGIMLHRRVNSEHFVRYFTCQPRNEKR